MVTWCLRKTPASHTDALFNEDNYNNYTEGAHLAKGRLMRSLYTAKMSNNSNKVINNERKLSLVN